MSMRLLNRIGFVAILAAFAHPVIAQVSQAPPKGSTTNGVYIVQMRANPAIAYDGGLPGLAATKPQPGQKWNPLAEPVQEYIAHLEATHLGVLSAVGASRDTVYNYYYTFNGFAARLNDEQVAALEARDDIVQIWRDELRRPQTNTSSQFLGLSGQQGVWSRSGVLGEDIVIAVIDTGIWPEHPSFADSGAPGPRAYRYREATSELDFDREQGLAARFGAGPAKWVGDACAFGNSSFNTLDVPFRCTGKLVGARYYASAFSSAGTRDGAGLVPGEYLSARDNDGHGSHTASTAAGNLFVPASIEGESLGRISGMAPRARLAAYKVCWNGSFPPDGFASGCASSDSMAAIDQAVADGVDVINFSIGGSSTNLTGPDDVAFLFAAQAGVFVATSNGNSGPGSQTVGTPAGAPWIMSVGAAQDDAVFNQGLDVASPASVAGVYEGVEGAGPVAIADTGALSGRLVPAVPLQACGPLTNGAAIRGNIALVIRGACGFSEKYLSVQSAGATAIIVYTDGADATRIDPIEMGGLTGSVAIPGMMIGFPDGDALVHAPGVLATLSPDVLVSNANSVAGFSSRGPNGGAPDIIKPDVAAPGVQILAAHTPTPNDGKLSHQLFQSISGTSMASPHVAGVAALLLQKHPGWSPAMIRSALMTTARQNLTTAFGDAPADAFDIGAGHIVPRRALDPGLVYDANSLDYLAFLCVADAQSPFTSPDDCAQLQNVTGVADPSDLNLPSIGIASLAGSQTVTRTVTSVARSHFHSQGQRSYKRLYHAIVNAPAGVDVDVQPRFLWLDDGETATYEVFFDVRPSAAFGSWTFGSVAWRTWMGNDVRSPIAVRPVAFESPGELADAGPNGSLSFDVAFGRHGSYSRALVGLTAADTASGFVEGPSAGAAGFAYSTFTAPAGTTHVRVATYDEDVDDAGDDIDLRVFRCLDASSDEACMSTVDGVVGSSNGATSREQVDAPGAPPGGYLVVVDGYFTVDPRGTSYKVFFYAVSGVEGNATATGPAAATPGPATIGVRWSGLDTGTRHLGFVSHRDARGEMGRTMIEIDTR